MGNEDIQRLWNLRPALLQLRGAQIKCHSAKNWLPRATVDAEPFHFDQLVLQISGVAEQVGVVFEGIVVVASDHKLVAMRKLSQPLVKTRHIALTTEVGQIPPKKQNVPWGDVKTIGLDEGSRTSAALTKILLGERFGVEPQTIPSFPLKVGRYPWSEREELHQNRSRPRAVWRSIVR